MKRLTWLLAVWGTFACGGRVEVDGPAEPAQAGAAAASSAGAGQMSGASPSLPGHDLDVCVPGFAHADFPERPCGWLILPGICFDTKNAACACVCPTDRNSTCYSAFPEPGVPTLVRCE